MCVCVYCVCNDKALRPFYLFKSFSKLNNCSNLANFFLWLRRCAVYIVNTTTLHTHRTVPSHTAEKWVGLSCRGMHTAHASPTSPISYWLGQYQLWHTGTCVRDVIITTVARSHISLTQELDDENVITTVVLGHHGNWPGDLHYIKVYNILHDWLLGYCKHVNPNSPIPLKSVAGSVPWKPRSFHCSLTRDVSFSEGIM